MIVKMADTSVRNAFGRITQLAPCILRGISSNYFIALSAKGILKSIEASFGSSRQTSPDSGEETSPLHRDTETPKQFVDDVGSRSP